MSEKSLLLAVAIAALLIAGVTGYVTNRSVGELREAQLALVREVQAMKAGRQTAISTPPLQENDLRLESIAADTVEAAKAIDRAEIEVLRRRIADIETNDRMQFARTEAIDRVTRLEGKARAKALEDLEVLVSLGDDEAIQVVLQGLFDPDPRVRESALGVIAQAGDPSLIDELEPLLRDPSQDVRKELADALENAPADKAGPLLMKLLDDSDREVVEDAVKSLGSIRYEDARYRIAELVDPENPKLTGAAGEALRDFGDVSGMEDAIAALAQSLENENPDIRKSAVKEIGQIGGPSARAYLETALEDDDSEVQREARKRIAKL